jgi:hypothetical protein
MVVMAGISVSSSSRYLIAPSYRGAIRQYSTGGPSISIDRPHYSRDATVPSKYTNICRLPIHLTRTCNRYVSCRSIHASWNILCLMRSLANHTVPRIPGRTITMTIMGGRKVKLMNVVNVALQYVRLSFVFFSYFSYSLLLAFSSFTRPPTIRSPTHTYVFPFSVLSFGIV